MNRDNSKCAYKTLASVFLFFSTIKDLRLGDKRKKAMGTESSVTILEENRGL